MQNKQMLSYFDSRLKSKLSNEYKNKSTLDIISNYKKYTKYIPFNTKLNNKLFVLKKIERNLTESNKNILIKSNILDKTNNNLLSNINYDLNNKINLMIPNNNKIIYNNNNLINRITNSNFTNNINLPLNILGNSHKNNNNNYLNLITTFNPELAKVKNTVFNFNLINNKILSNVYSILEYSFKSMSSLISKPYLYINQDKIIIHIFFYNKVMPKFKLFRNKFYKNSLNRNKISKNNSTNKWNINRNKSNITAIQNNQKLPFLILNKTKLSNLCALLSKIFNKSVELELTQLHRVYHEPNILVNALGSIVNKIKLRRILKKLFKAIIIKNPTRLINRKRFSVVPCVLAGLSVKVAGRVMTQRVVPRKTVKFTQKGSLSRTKSIFVENARFTNKNKRGSFSITVTSGYFL